MTNETKKIMSKAFIKTLLSPLIQFLAFERAPVWVLVIAGKKEKKKKNDPSGDANRG